MNETLELRIPHEHVGRLFGPTEGRALGDLVRLVEISTKDPRMKEIGRLQHKMQATEDELFFYGWGYHRRYTTSELERAELFQLEITAAFEPEGESCGTVYDESSACSLCGAGAKQMSQLILDLRKVPKTKDIARTIADESIVSQRLAELLFDAGMTGFALEQVRHKARYQDDPVPFEKYPTGRKLLRRAEAAGTPFPTWEFYVWLNRPERAELVRRGGKWGRF